jgi:hypothetical protein
MQTESALVLLKKTDKFERRYFAGDPATTFHELRRFLFMQGVDSKLYSACKLPSRSYPSPSLELFSIDNAFFSEFRSMVAVECAKKRTVLNTLIFVLRVFISSDGDGNSGTMQVLLNHLHDGIYELNQMYSPLCQFLNDNHWEPSPAAGTGLSLVTEMVFQYPFSGVHEFTSMYFKLQPVLDKYEMVGCNLPIESPF